MTRRATAVQFIKFCCVGVANVLVDFGVYQATGYFVPMYVARTFSWVVACLFSYAVNKRWTFRAQDTGLLPLVRFGVVNLGSLSLGLLLLYVFTLWGCNPTIAFLLSLPFTTVSNYLGYKLWSFRQMG